ncbi:hypothetical protein WH50_06425 [Pokkaliibacter plantistimulans]|uniref:Uncharacterized protein n=2 Tax=Pokkaliibacter plantistimulans TaxID=1635171 RepID=A0ABX5M2B2_9GAMM|nr:hypothetical protein WH50_06425 [Pokkaliibacter plantistimulans]
MKIDQVGKRTELLYIKMYPDGTSQVGTFEPQDRQLYFTTTVDAAFEKFIVGRYGVLPETIKRDYSEAAVFMSEAEYQRFITPEAKGGFGAVERVTDISSKINTTPRVEIKWRYSDHYDSIPSSFESGDGRIIKSNIYFTRINENAQGIPLPDGTEQLVLRAKWRFLSKDELKEKAPDWLRINPAGIEIVDYDIVSETNSDQK